MSVTNGKMKEYRLGNHVRTTLLSKGTVCKIAELGENFCCECERGVRYGDFEPIPIKDWDIPKGLKYPNWIKSVHELQNWYYWNNNKKELAFKYDKN